MVHVEGLDDVLLNTSRGDRSPMITTKGFLAAVAVALIIGVIIQYSVSGTFFGWWMLAPLPFTLIGEAIWSRQRHSRS